MLHGGTQTNPTVLGFGPKPAKRLGARGRHSEGDSHIGDDGMTVVLGDKVLDLAGSGVGQPVAPYEVVRNVELLGIRHLAIDVGHRPPIGTIVGTS